MPTWLRTETPEVFKAPSLDRLGLVYAETRRDLSEPLATLSGSMSVQEMSGDIPLVISRKNYERSGASLPFEDWANFIKHQVESYDATVKHELGFSAIGYLNPVHGTDLLDLDLHMAHAEMAIPFAERPYADAAVVRKLGRASCIAPADCLVVNVVDPESETLLQMHAGYVGLQNRIVGKTFQRLRAEVNPRRSLAYVSPHAQKGFVINQINNGLVDRFEQSPELAPYLVRRSNGDVELDMTSSLVQQLEEAGVRPENIQVSQDNSLTDPTLYSQSDFLTRSINGRNGMFFGRRR